MTTHLFDRLSMTLARKLSRRAALRSTGAGLAAGLTGHAGLDAIAQEATPDAAPTPLSEDGAFLFVQTATSGAFQPNPQVGTPVVDGTPALGGGADYLLALDGHAGGTIYFSDRPERIVGDAPTQQFLEGFGFTPANPPNAALVTQADDGTEEVIVLELLDPAYDAAAGTITYGATILSEYEGEGLTHLAAQQQDTEVPAAFGRASLFIDDCADITSCVAFEGLDMNPYVVGDVPGGPYGACWHWSSFSCQPCSESQDYLDGLCNNAYSECSGDCSAS